MAVVRVDSSAPIVVVLSVLIILLVVTFLWRARRIRVLTAFAASRRTLDSNGVVVGGEGFALVRAGAPAVLIVHGAGDTPQTVRHLAEALFARGYHVHAPLLPGHGRTVDDFRRVHADQWTNATRAEYAAVRRAHHWVGVIGVSMGGALAVQLAAETPDLPALGLVAPYLAMPRRIERAAQWSWLWGLLTPVVRSADGLSILDPVERERNLAYGVFTSSALRALRTTMRRAVAALPNVTAPTLVIQSREDNRISPADATRAFSALRAKERRLEWISGAAHIITVDYGKETVIAALASWMDQHHRCGDVSL